MGTMFRLSLIGIGPALLAFGAFAPDAVGQAKPVKPVATPPAAVVVPAGDADAGAKLYERKCTGCHSLDNNSVGPKHRGVVGRRAGTVPGYAYSGALVKSKLIWTEANLDVWLKGPPKLVPGTRMGLALSDATERRNVIAFLAKNSTPKP